MKKLPKMVLKNIKFAFKEVLLTYRYLRRKLLARFTFLNRWDKWRFKQPLQIIGTSFSFVVVLGLFLQPILNAAPDLSNNWDFSTPADYTGSSGVDITASGAKLKAQNYQNDANTMALYHFDESGGSVVSDSSSNNNTGTLHSGSFTTGNLNNAVSINNPESYISIDSSASLQLGQQQTLEGWVKFSSSFNSSSNNSRSAVIDKGDYQLYFDNENGKLTYELANSSANSWSQVAGRGRNGSWDSDGKRIVNAITKMGSNYYYAIGMDLGDAEVWKWDGTTWTLVGGGFDPVNGSWDGNTYEGVYSLATDGTNLYAGLGSGTGEGEVWRYNGSTWTKIGGDSLNGGWTNYAEVVYTLDYFGGDLYAGIGNSANDAEVWQWNGTTWTKIGGDSINSGWTTNYEVVNVLTDDGTNLYAGLGTTANDAEVWQWDGTSWDKIGGDSINSGWGANYETIQALKFVGGNLYAGLGNSANDAEVWRYNGTSWTMIGGDSINSGWGANYELVASFAWDGTNLYAGLGSSNGDGEAWKWNGTSWTKIGGDGLNGSWSTNEGDTVNAMLYDSGRLYIGTYDAGGGGLPYYYDGSTWTRFGGNYINHSWGFYGTSAVQVLQAQGGYLYAGMGNTAGSAYVYRYNGTTWQLIGGQGVNNSWTPETYEQIMSMASYNGKLYVGLGISANDAEVWEWDNDSSTWTKVGGDSINSGWGANFEEVDSLAVNDGYLYAGLGNSASDAEVWRYNGINWARIGGDNINSGWPTGYYNVYSMAIFKGKLEVGLGRSANQAEVWEWNNTTSTWSKIGGDGLASSWSNNIESVESLMPYGEKLYAGLGNSSGDAGLWEYDGSSWTQIGGDDINGSWTTGVYEKVKTIASYNGDLYAGLGNSTGDGEVWKYSGGAWTKIAGNGINSGWGATVEEVESFSEYHGKLYAGTGYTTNADGDVWAWGDNGFLQSNTSSFDTNWHHIAATFDGSTMKLYIDGVQDGSLSKLFSVASSSRGLLIGSGYGGREYGKPAAQFNGLLDEIRLSNNVRSSFTTKPYPSTPQTVQLASAVRKSGVWHWDTFSDVNSMPDGGSITYRVSTDEGSTWKYWDGLTWSTSNSLTDTNLASVINTNIATLPVSFDGFMWQAVLSGNGNQQLSITGVDAQATSDITDPSSPPSSIIAKVANAGSTFNDGDWTNGSSPYFSWTAGADGESGVLGYCAYLGTDQTALPLTSKGMLGTSPVPTGGACPFVVSGNDIDLATPGLLATPLSSSNSYYYLTLSTIDKAGNVSGATTQFSFKFDNTPPSNPGFITAPSGFINTKDVEMSWPSSGGSAPQDANSGVAGLQYRIGSSGTWYGDSHTGLGDKNDLLANDGTYQTQNTPDFADLIEGINTVYFRTWDNAGNYTTSYATATLKINTTGAPSQPLNLYATPSTNTINSFGFNWDIPTTYVGNPANITYCYTVNIVPSLTSCAYTGAGSTELTVGPYATQPGLNTLYVVARDESSNINYDNYASIGFTANTSAPGVPLNTDIVDVSIKSTSNWRLALTWDEPTDTGSGITSYHISRSTDDVTFVQVGTSSSTTYIDAGLSQQTYYYKVSACDNTNNCGANSASVNAYPTGKFTTPATLTSGPTVDGTTTKRAHIAWSTDRASDSKIAIGTQSGHYSPSEIGNSDQVSAHNISLDNLSPGTTYYFVAKWTDEDGNTGTSQEQTFTTSPAPSIKEATVDSVNLSAASISFTTKDATKAKIYFGLSDSFGGVKEVNTSIEESRYQIDLDGLTDGSKYYFMVSTIDQEGAEYPGNVMTFTTPARPRISNLRFQPVAGEPTSTQEISWSTNVPSTTRVVYSTSNGTPIELQDSKMVTDHKITITNLEDDSNYSLVAYSRDNSGNLAASDRQSFKTALDTRPPKVSNIVVESSIRGSGSEARGQIVVSWQTDELSTSQVAYGEGSDATTFNNKSAEDTRMTTEHIVIISDLPTSRVYSIKPISFDKARNAGSGEPQTAIISRASDSAVTIIFNTLKAIFGL